MKKIIATVIILNTLVMCQKAEVKQLQDHIKSADSLISSVNDNLKNIDSISVNLDSVSIPQIIKEKEKLEKVFNDSKKSIDSLDLSIDNFKKTVESKEIQKKIDSVSSKIKSLDDLKKLKEQVKVVYKDRPQQQTQPKLDVLTKSANIELNVDNLTLARQQLSGDLSQYNGRIETENVVSNNELQTMYVTAKVPLSRFDSFVESISNNLGNIKSKNIEVKGQDYTDNQMCTVQLTLVENQNLISENKDKPKNQSFSEKAGDAFGSGGKVLGDIVLFLLPFWPLFLIAGVGIFIYKKKFSKKNNGEKTDQATSQKENENEM